MNDNDKKMPEACMEDPENSKQRNKSYYRNRDRYKNSSMGSRTPDLDAKGLDMLAEVISCLRIDAIKDAVPDWYDIACCACMTRDSHHMSPQQWVDTVQLLSIRAARLKMELEALQGVKDSQKALWGKDTSSGVN